MMNRFKKLMLLCAGLMTSISTFAISTAGAWMAGIGGAAAVTMLAVGIHKAKQRRAKYDNESDNVTRKKDKRSHKESSYKNRSKRSRSEQKKELRRDLNDKKLERNRHKQDLRRLKQRGQADSAEAREHRSLLKDAEADIKDIENRLKNI